MNLIGGHRGQGLRRGSPGAGGVESGGRGPYEHRVVQDRLQVAFRRQQRFPPRVVHRSPHPCLHRRHLRAEGKRLGRGFWSLASPPKASSPPPEASSSPPEASSPPPEARAPFVKASSPEADALRPALGARSPVREASKSARPSSKTARQASGAGDEATRAGDEACGAGDEACGAGDEACGAGDEACGAGDEACGAGDEASGAGDEARTPQDEAPRVGARGYGSAFGAVMAASHSASARAGSRLSPAQAENRPRLHSLPVGSNVLSGRAQRSCSASRSSRGTKPVAASSSSQNRSTQFFSRKEASENRSTSDKPSSTARSKAGSSAD